MTSRWFSRPKGRLFCWSSLTLCLLLAHTALATGPVTTIVNDVIYRADGTPAQGTLLISWNAFVTADQKAVSAGSMSLAIGNAGAISVALIPNVGATPQGTFYKVILKLDDGTTSNENWSVGTSSPTTISAIRVRVLPTSQA